MATLRGTSGAALVGDFGRTLGAGFEAANVRRRAADDQADLQSKLQAALGLGGPSSQVVDDAALGRLGQLSPETAQAVGQARQNPEAAGQLREQTQQGLALSQELQKLPDHASRLSRLTKEAGRIHAEGGDLSRLVALANMDEGALDLELQRMQVIGNDVISSLPPPPPSATDAFAALIADNPQVGTALLGRRDQQIAQERARQAAEAKARAAAAARARASAGPQGPLAKGLAQIEHNLAGGFITPEQAAARRTRLQSEVASDPGVAADLATRSDALQNQKLVLENRALEAQASGDLSAMEAVELEQAELNVEETRLSNEAAVAERDTPQPFEAVTDLGKVIQDEQSVIETFGADSPQAAAFAELRTAEEAGDPASLSDIGGIRKEFTSQSADFVIMRNADDKIRVAAEDPSAAGDLSLIFNYMKILDPNSVVRESEFATAANAAGVPDRVRNTFNRVLSGERLAEDQRLDFVETARRLFDSQLSNQRLLEREFTGIAERASIDPQDVIVDFVGEPTATPSPAVATLSPPAGVIPDAVRSNQSLIDTAVGSGLSVEEVWNFLSEDARALMLGASQ